MTLSPNSNDPNKRENEILTKTLKLKSDLRLKKICNISESGLFCIKPYKPIVEIIKVEIKAVIDSQ